jgi:plastocyanin
MINKIFNYFTALFFIITLSGMAAASSVSITSQQDYMQQQFVSNGSFPSGYTDLLYRMRLQIEPESGNFQVSKVVIYNTPVIGVNRTYYRIDNIEKGRGTISIFSDRVEWQGLSETPVSDFELGIYAANTYRRSIPFSSTRSIDKEIFNGQEIVTGFASATPSQNLKNLKISFFTSESNNIYSELLPSTATNIGNIVGTSDEVTWNFENVQSGYQYTASLQGIGTPKISGTVRAWPYTRIEGGYGSYSYSNSGYGASIVRYTDTVIGDVEIYFANPVDYQIQANGRGIYYQRFREFSEIVTNGEPATIEIEDNFKPGIRTVPANTTVTWTNNQKVHHSVVSDTGLFSSPLLDLDEQFPVTFNNPGTYDYHCGNHPSMTGRIIVTATTPTLVDSYLPPGATPAERKSGLIRAMDDYFDNGTLTKAELLSVMDAYFT